MTTNKIKPVESKGQRQQALMHTEQMWRVIKAYERGEITQEMAEQACATLKAWYVDTGTAIDTVIPAYLRLRRKPK